MALIDFSLSDVGDLLRAGREMVTGKTVINPEKVMEYELKSREIEQALLNGQLEINKMEAQHPSIFVAGWRPAIGWIGATALAVQFIIRPVVEWTAAFNGTIVTLPDFNSAELMNLILAMLGVGVMRSYDKKQGTDTKKIGK